MVSHLLLKIKLIINFIYSLDKTPLIFILDKESIIKKIQETNINIVQDKFYVVSFEENKNNINIFFDNL